MRVFVAAIVLLLAAATTLAQSPSIFTNPSIDLSTIRRFSVVPFSADRSETVRDPFAQQKATILLIAALRKRSLLPIDFETIVKRVGEDTGVDFSGPSSEEKVRIFVAELPKHVDAVLLGHVSAWGLFSRESTQSIRVPVYGYVSGYGGSATWQSNQWIPVQRTRDVSIVGLSLAILTIGRDSPPTLAWQSDRGGNFVWQQPRAPDTLATDFLNDIVNAMPLSAK